MLTGFDSALTAEDIMAKYADASKQTTAFNADIDATLDASLNILGMANDYKLSYDMTMSATTDPLSYKMSGPVTMEITDTPSYAADMEMYMVPEGDQYAMYYNVALNGDPSWSKSTVAAAEVQPIIDQLMSASFDFTQFPVVFALADAPVTANGKECYELSASLTLDELVLLVSPYLDSVNAGVSGEDLQAYASMLPGLQFNFVLDVDTASFRPIAMHLDCDGSDWSAIAATISMIMTMNGVSSEGDESVPQITLDVRTLSMDVVYDYDSPVEITLPAEAASATDLGSVDQDSLLSMVMDAE